MVDSYYRSGSTQPYYIVGQRSAVGQDQYAKKAGTALDLLVFRADPLGTDDLKVITVVEDQFEDMLRRGRALLYTEFTASELQRMFDPDTGKLRAERLGERMKTRLSERALRKLPSRKTTPEKLWQDGIQVSMNEYQKSGKVLEDSVLASFDVFTHLNRLAVAFGKGDELRELIERSAGVAPESPIDTLIDEDLRAETALLETDD